MIHHDKLSHIIVCDGHQGRVQDFTEGAPTPKGIVLTHYLAKISRKIHENKENCTEGETSKILLCRCSTGPKWDILPHVDVLEMGVQWQQPPFMVTYE